ncbi:MAG: hypothetical protein JZU55_19190, partial [Afipia sp.]|nr:hypothetical protein [Afipia sp.]
PKSVSNARMMAIDARAQHRGAPHRRAVEKLQAMLEIHGIDRFLIALRLIKAEFESPVSIG